MFDLRRAVRRGTVEYHGDLKTLVSNRLQDQLTNIVATPLGPWQTVKEVVAVDQQRHENRSLHLARPAQQTLELSGARQILVHLIGAFVVRIDGEGALERFSLPFRVIPPTPEIRKLEP